jgi:hypothetical protein
MQVYVSKHSEYYFENSLEGKRELLKKGDNLVKLVDPTYADLDSLKDLTNKYKIKKDKKLSKDDGEKFLEDLKGHALSLDKIGGMFVYLDANDENYLLCHTSTIYEILEKGTGEYVFDDLDMSGSFAGDISVGDTSLGDTSVGDTAIDSAQSNASELKQDYSSKPAHSLKEFEAWEKEQKKNNGGKKGKKGTGVFGFFKRK